MDFKDQEIKCKLCGDTFVWTAGEQEYYHDLGLSQPKKCPTCRAYLRRKLHRQQAASKAEVQHG